MKYTEEQISQAMEEIPTLWIAKYKIKNEAGNPIEFKQHNFLYDIYNDFSTLQVVLKPPQIGMTVLQIIKTLYAAKKKGWDIIYTLPTSTDVHDMAGGKINRIIAQNSILKEWVKDHDTVDQKSVGENIIYYRGTFSPKQAMMVSSKLNVHDEVDASDPIVIQQYETRLQAQADGMRWYFSHPSIAGFGVDQYWQQSDKKEWFITCNKCNEEQILTFPENIIEGKYACSRCHHGLSEEERIRGSWKATSGGLYSGYHISQLMCPWITPEKILKDKAEKDNQYFWNYVLGLPYVGSENKIDPSVILRNVTSRINAQEGRIVIGVDTGLPIHYVLLNKEGVFYYGKCSEKDPYAELEKYLQRWKTSILVSDQGGDLIGIRQLQAKYPGRVFLCYYRKDRNTKEMIQWGENEEYGKVVVDRNRMIQMIVEQMRDLGRILLHGTQEDWQEFADHFGNIYRELVTVKETPGKDNSAIYGDKFVWKRTGPDHFVHSLLYGLVGLDRFFEQDVKIIGTSALDEFSKPRFSNVN